MDGRICPDGSVCVFASMLCEMLNSSTQMRLCRLCWEASDTDFWTIRREIALLLKDRAGTASPGLVREVEDRILQTGDAYYDRYTVEPGEADWCAHARDAAVWVHLNMLQDASVLSEIGSAELSAITERRDYLNREVEDRDFFRNIQHRRPLYCG